MANVYVVSCHFSNALDMAAIAKRWGCKKTAHTFSDTASMTLRHVDVFPVGDRLSRKWPKHSRQHAELVVVNHYIDARLVELADRCANLRLIIHRINPKRIQICFREPRHFKTHKRDLSHERDISCDGIGR